MRALTNDQVESILKELNVAWSAIPGQGFVRVFDTISFAQSLELVGKIAALADKQQHYPKVVLSANEVEVTLDTPEVGGITEMDVDLAKAIDEVKI